MLTVEIKTLCKIPIFFKSTPTINSDAFFLVLRPAPDPGWSKPSGIAHFIGNAVPHPPNQTRKHQSQVGTWLSCQNNRKEQQCICKSYVHLQVKLEVSRHSKASKESSPRPSAQNYPTNTRGIYATPSSLSRQGIVHLLFNAIFGYPDYFYLFLTIWKKNFWITQIINMDDDL